LLVAKMTLFAGNMTVLRTFPDANVAATGLDPANDLVVPFGSAAVAGCSDSAVTLKWEIEAFAAFSLGKTAALVETTFGGFEVSSAFSAGGAGLPATVPSIKPSP
jgi:hypothetical protein